MVPDSADLREQEPCLGGGEESVCVGKAVARKQECSSDGAPKSSVSISTRYLRRQGCRWGREHGIGRILIYTRKLSPGR